MTDETATRLFLVITWCGLGIIAGAIIGLPA